MNREMGEAWHRDEEVPTCFPPLSLRDLEATVNAISEPVMLNTSCPKSFLPQ